MRIVEDIKFDGVVDDFSDLNEIDELKKKLYIDPVLNCRNRACFEDNTKNLSANFTYFSIDGNNLKYINDNFGHEKGDLLLKIIAHIGVQIWGNNFYRFGGDEFGALILESQSETVSSDQIQKFKKLIEYENEKYADFPISASIGFANNDNDESLEEVIQQADEMMYHDKKLYKEKFPQYDMRKARLTSETLKDALESGDFSKAYRELKGEKEKPEKEVTLVEDDLSFDGFTDPAESLHEKQKSHELSVVKQEDLSGVAVADDESDYESNELSKKIQPVLKETTEKAVKDAVKYHNDKLKLEVAEVLDDEVSYRLSKYEKRRRRRDFKERVSSITKGVVIFLVVLFILGNQQLRLRFALVFQDIGEMITAIAKGEDTSSNKLVEDLFRDLGDDLNEVNTVENTGFDFEE